MPMLMNDKMLSISFKSKRMNAIEEAEDEEEKREELWVEVWKLIKKEK